MLRGLHLWLPVAAWAALIFALSSLSGDALPQTPPEWRWLPLDKLAHAGLFGVLSMLIVHALRRGHRWALASALMMAISGAAAYGALDEWRQTLVTLRNPSWADWMADVVGAVLGAWLYYRYEPRTGKTANCPTA